MRLDIHPVAVKASSIATGGSLVHAILTVTIPGLIPSDPSPYASYARKLNVAAPQKSGVGRKSIVPSESKLVILPCEAIGGSNNE